MTLGPAVAQEPQAGNPDKGLGLAREHCSRCHIVEVGKGFGIGSTPSFPLLVKMDDWEERFQSFFERLPHPSVVRVEGVDAWTDLPSAMVEIEIRLEDVDHLTAYARQLQSAAD